MKSLAKPYLDGESGYRITSTVSSIAGEGLAYNPISDIMANNADASSCFLASKLASLTHNTAPATSSSESYPRQSARSSSAHSHITPCHGERSSPTLSDIVRFRNRIGILSEFLRNPRHRPPKPVVRSDSDASTQHSDDTKSSKK
ncbi:hypothetical protein OESDEN_02307 [Oesophagostomum dentatum]|uniref:Uncharacterized protein n=1 Tax=Oesophagostomum dentatum TaxID=61180 RepID=A0A0B1TKF5_OESDE|nr:hypothetical protein OESDEN_02307 [Oesophagostomum dentatum]